MSEKKYNAIVRNKQDIFFEPLFFSVLGEPASKANSRRIVKFGNLSRMIKSQKALDYSSAFKRQVKAGRLLEGDVVVEMTIWYASRRPDLDESLILDLLQGVAYTNDRQVKEKHIFWGLDKENPRTEIMVWQKKTPQ
jgi:Holliday junction resolvase RusA-like endonuclease